MIEGQIESIGIDPMQRKPKRIYRPQVAGDTTKDYICPAEECGIDVHHGATECRNGHLLIWDSISGIDGRPVRQNPQVCPTCGGGKYIVGAPFTDGIFPKTSVCPYCHGTGKAAPAGGHTPDAGKMEEGQPPVCKHRDDYVSHNACSDADCNGCPFNVGTCKPAPADEVESCATCASWIGGLCHTPALDQTSADQRCERWVEKIADDPVLSMIREIRRDFIAAANEIPVNNWMDKLEAAYLASKQKEGEE